MRSSDSSRLGALPLPRREAGSSRTTAGAVHEQSLRLKDLTVTVRRKSVKNVSLRVLSPSAEVVVTCPFDYPESDIRQLVERKHEWIITNRVRIRRSPEARVAGATPDQQQEWKAVVSACVPPLIKAWEPILGVKAGPLAYRNMKSRWGSCQPATGRICINIRLALYPPQCLEYVVVHELCHLLVANHGPDFKELMDSVMPDWKHWRDVLDGKER